MARASSNSAHSDRNAQRSSKVLDTTPPPVSRARRHAETPEFDASNVADEVERIRNLSKNELRFLWLKTHRTSAPAALSKDLLARALAYSLQEQVFGGLDRATAAMLDRLARGERSDAVKERRLQTGTVLVREYQGERHTVTIAGDEFIWKEDRYPSLSTIARAITGTAWNGPKFFGLRSSSGKIAEGAPT